MNEIIVAMTESDAHVVANKLLEVYLQEQGYSIINLGACTPLREVAETAAANAPQAIVLGSQNGHALEDISGLSSLKTEFHIDCPVILGGNLSVGAEKSDDLERKLKTAGVDFICQDFEDLSALLEELAQYSTQQEVKYA